MDSCQFATSSVKREVIQASRWISKCCVTCVKSAASFGPPMCNNGCRDQYSESTEHPNRSRGKHRVRRHCPEAASRCARAVSCIQIPHRRCRREEITFNHKQNERIIAEGISSKRPSNLDERRHSDRRRRQSKSVYRSKCQGGTSRKGSVGFNV